MIRSVWWIIYNELDFRDNKVDSRSLSVWSLARLIQARR